MFNNVFYYPQSANFHFDISTINTFIYLTDNFNIHRAQLISNNRKLLWHKGSQTSEYIPKVLNTSPVMVKCGNIWIFSMSSFDLFFHYRVMTSSNDGDILRQPLHDGTVYNRKQELSLTGPPACPHTRTGPMTRGHFAKSCSKRALQPRLDNDLRLAHPPRSMHASPYQQQQ